PPAPCRRNRPEVRQHALKSLPRAAGAGIVPPELLDEFLLAATHEAQAALDPRLGREALTAFGGHLESRGDRRSRDGSSCQPPCLALRNRVPRPPALPSSGRATIW